LYWPPIQGRIPDAAPNLQGDHMTTISKKLSLTLGIVLIGMLLGATANADCGGLKLKKPAASFQPQSWQEQFQPSSMLLVQQNNDSIVGMWKVNFTAKGNPNGPPDGTPIDAALVVWHNDGTEIMNSGRPAQDGDFCMGVWAKTGANRYRLNHFAWGGNDTTNAPTGIGNPTGPTHVTETVTLNSDATAYSGTFVLTAYDTSGNITAQIRGTINATRITVDTTVHSLL
jgi:hypothetical protein